MMKKVLLGMALALMSAAGYAQGVLGKWYTEAGDAQVEIYQSGDKSLSPRRNGRAAESTTPRMARTISAPSGLMVTN